MLLGRPGGLELARDVGERRGGQRCAGRGQADAVGAGGAGGVDEVDGVDAVAAAALGVVENVVEDGHAAEVVVLADLVGLVAKLGDGEAGRRAWACRAFWSTSG